MPNNLRKIGVLVAQLGTPQAPTAKAVRPYLRQFLSDPRVVDLHPLKWYPILYLLVLTRRPARSAALYAKIWTDEGSPLMIHSKAQTKGLQERLGDDYRVILGMRYGEPSIQQAIKTLEVEGIDRILIFSMYPQFSSTTTGAIYDAVNRAANGRRCPWFFDRKRQMPTLRFVPPYFDHPAYIEALKQSITDETERLAWKPDRHLITFHCIPKRYVDEGDRSDGLERRPHPDREALGKTDVLYAPMLCQHCGARRCSDAKQGTIGLFLSYKVTHTPIINSSFE